MFEPTSFLDLRSSRCSWTSTTAKAHRLWSTQRSIGLKEVDSHDWKSVGVRECSRSQRLGPTKLPSFNVAFALTSARIWVSPCCLPAIVAVFVVMHPGQKRVAQVDAWGLIALSKRWSRVVNPNAQPNSIAPQHRRVDRSLAKPVRAYTAAATRATPMSTATPSSGVDASIHQNHQVSSFT